VTRHPWQSEQLVASHRADLVRQAARRGSTTSAVRRAPGVVRRDPVTRHIGLLLMVSGRWLAAEPVGEPSRGRAGMARHA
jgi:hypothetical protein